MNVLSPFTYGIAVAHFVPGFLMYVSFWILFWDRTASYFKLYDEKLWIPFALTSAVVCFAIGLLIDGVRADLFDSFIRWARRDARSYTPPKGMYQVIRSEESVRILDYLIEKYYRFYQLYANTCVALFLLAVLWLVRCTSALVSWWRAGSDPSRQIVILLMLGTLTYVMFGAARRALSRSVETMEEFKSAHTPARNSE